jgi:mono/diheme cytochrome c family protein
MFIMALGQIIQAMGTLTLLLPRMFNGLSHKGAAMRTTSKIAGVVLWIAMLLLPISFSAAQETNSKKAETHIKSIASGKALFMQHCASCHSADAKGAGPVAVALKKRPPDLTVLAKRNHGRFPYDEVSKAINGDFEVPAHGSKEMPTWGPLFLALTDLNVRKAENLTTNLTDYIKSIQVK